MDTDSFETRQPPLAPVPPARGRGHGEPPLLRIAPPGGAATAEDEARLIAALAAGDERAAAVMYDRYAAMLMGVAFRVTRSRVDAEEVVLETLEQAWRQARRYEASRGSLEAWLTIIARSRAFDRVRSAQRRERHVVAIEDEPGGALLEAPHDGSSPSDAAEAADAQRLVAVALAALPAAQREAVELAFYDGLSHAEVAARTGEALGTVKTRIRLAMMKLRDTLRPLAPGGAA